AIERNGVSEAFVKTLKRDDARIQPRPDAVAVLQQLHPKPIAISPMSGLAGATPTWNIGITTSALREQDRAWIEQAEKACTRFVAAWPKKPIAKRKRAPTAALVSGFSLLGHAGYWREIGLDYW